MKFRSSDGEIVHLALTNGHTFTVGADLVEVPRMFHGLAIARGCLPEGVGPEQLAEQRKGVDKDDLILMGIKQIMQTALPEDFTGDGRPKVEKLSALVGFTVSAGERDVAWQAFNDADDA